MKNEIIDVLLIEEFVGFLDVNGNKINMRFLFDVYVLCVCKYKSWYGNGNVLVKVGCGIFIEFLFFF